MEKEARYTSADIGVPDCSFQDFCVKRDGAMTHFCHCLKRIGAQKRDGTVLIECDYIGDRYESQDTE